MVSGRQGFQKVFDLTERVIPAEIDTSVPTDQEYCEHLIKRFLIANGIGTAAEIAYLRKGLKPTIEQQCIRMHENQELQLLKVNGKTYFALINFSEHLKSSRMRELFGFDYKIECYVSPEKRKYGYFVLPILAGNEFVGRMDAKIDRSNKILTVYNLHLRTAKFDAILPKLESALCSFLEFNKGEAYKFEKATLNGKAFSKSWLKALAQNCAR